MKKRAKIITTIASLCLAVALLAFGVYAASTVSFAVTSKVKFEVTDVFVDITGDVYKSADGTATGQAPLATQYTGSTYTGSAGSRVPMATIGSNGNLAWSVNGGTAMALTSAQSWVRYEISFENVEGKPINVAAQEANSTVYTSTNMTRGTLTFTTDETSPQNGTDQGAGNELSCTNLPVGNTVTFIYTAHVTNLALDITEFDINLNFTITQYSAQE